MYQFVSCRVFDSCVLRVSSDTRKLYTFPDPGGAWVFDLSLGVGFWVDFGWGVGFLFELGRGFLG